MNKVILMGRTTADPEIRYANTNSGQLAIARYTLAVNRPGKPKEGQQNADFIRCIAFGKAAEFAEKYMKKGGQYLISGHIQTDSYTDKETGKKVYTTDVVIESQEFTESKGTGVKEPAKPVDSDGFMDVSGDDDFLPFS